MTIQTKRSNVYKLLLLILLIGMMPFLNVMIFPDIQKRENRFRIIGTRDMIAYWAGFQVFRAGENPYIGKNVFGYQKLEIENMGQDQVFLNPPWTLPILAPVMCLPFQSARFAWMMLNILFLALSGLMVRGLFAGGQKTPYRKLLLWSVIFLPSVITIALGQLTLLVTFFLLAGMLTLQRGKDIVAGLLFIPVTVKPHLLFVVFIALAYWIIKNKRWQIVISGAAGFASLLALTEVLSPGIFTHWLQMDFSPLIFKTSTIITPIREFLLSFTGTVPNWPVMVVPMVVVLVVLGWLLIKRPAISWEYWLSPLLAISIFFAPYAWFHDYSLLCIMQMALVVRVYESSATQAHRKEILFWLAAIQGLVIIVVSLTNSCWGYFWFPLGMLLIWMRDSYLTPLSRNEITSAYT